MSLEERNDVAAAVASGGANGRTRHDTLVTHGRCGDVDSGRFSLNSDATTKSSTTIAAAAAAAAVCITETSRASRQPTLVAKMSNSNSDDTASVDSYETCGEMESAMFNGHTRGNNMSSSSSSSSQDDGATWTHERTVTTPALAVATRTTDDEMAAGGKSEQMSLSSSPSSSSSSSSSSSGDRMQHFSDADDDLPATFNNRVSIASDNTHSDTHTHKTTTTTTTTTTRRVKQASATQTTTTTTTTTTTSERPMYTSPVSELFEGNIISQVSCLECLNLSTTTESFQHLSLPIPSKDYVQSLHHNHNHHQRTQAAAQHTNATSSSQAQQVAASTTSGSGGGGWLWWMMDYVKSYVWTSHIKLSECLVAFFSDDDLKGDNKYSCEKCKKLTNGVKCSKILNLPEVTTTTTTTKNKNNSHFSKCICATTNPLDADYSAQALSP